MEGKSLNILIADDDADVIAPCLKAAAADIALLDVVTALTPAETLAVAARTPFDIIFLDIRFGPHDQSGIELIPLLAEQQPQTKIVMLSGLDDQHTMIHCVQQGAIDFCSKRGEGGPAQMIAVIKEHIEAASAVVNDYEEGQRIAKLVGAAYSSKAMSDVFTQVAIARRLRDQPVLITGETGAGKEIIASAINVATNRKKVDVDCGAIPDGLVESEFFGHKRGAFTGADTSKLGKFQLADKGDLFLDEIGNLKRSLQDKFLRAIQHKEITPVGGTAPQKVDVRVIAATNEDLDEMVRCGTFREDLLQRLRGHWIHIPPLRDRPEDIQPLAEHFIARSSKPHVKIAPTCMNLLKSYSWSGNARELENVLRLAVGCCHGDQVGIKHLPDHFKVALSAELDLAQSKSPEPVVTGGDNHKAYYLPLSGSLDQIKDHMLKVYLVDRFRRLGAGANKSKLAIDLSMSRNSLSACLSRLAIDLPDDEVNA